MSEFISNNSAFVLAVIGLFGAGGSALLRFILKSRCSEIKCCWCFIKRDVLPASQIEFSNNNNNNDTNV